MPNGEYAWLRPSTDVAENDDALYWPTESGHNLVVRWRAQEALFGHPWPTVRGGWLMAAARVFEIELRCMLYSRGYELELERLDQLPRGGTRCLVNGCGGTLFVADASSRWGADPAEIDWDEDRRVSHHPSAQNGCAAYRATC